MKIERLPQYDCEEIRDIPELDSKAYLLRHKKTRARVLVLENGDSNKVFSIAFRTTPKDNTGVAHIVEHTVLCGSEKYPAKDPFVELAKGSLNTFLNAMTYGDKTVYPLASTNEKDFRNLMSVYMDAVFAPNILKERMIFEQEGWHYELEEPEGELTINGVVYNEMKGAFSDVDEVMDRYTRHYLFPDNTYGFESGGDPQEIPQLTYEGYLDFYRSYYHPSNSFIYLYGDLQSEETLAWMDEEYLSHFDPKEVDSRVREQAPFSAVRQESIPYAAGEEDEEKGHLVWARVCGHASDPRRAAAFEVLEYVLLNAPGAPLKQALLDAGLGEDVYGGLNDGILQHYFSVTARNADPARREEFSRIIGDTLIKLAEEGLSRKSLLAAINSLEFRMKESDYGRLPKGLMIGLCALDGWLYDDAAAFSYIESEKVLAFLKEQVAGSYFEDLIRECLIDNSFGLELAAVPDKGLEARVEEELAEKLEAYRSSLSETEREALVRHTRELKAYQEEPSPKEVLETIPMLEVADITPKIQPLSNEEREIGGMPVLFHRVFTSGIVYVDLVFDADCLSLPELPWLSLLRSCLCVMDTEHFRYQELMDEINLHTGGIFADYNFYQPVGAEPTVKFHLRLKALAEKLPNALRLAEEIIGHSRLTDAKRLSEIIAEKHAQLQAGLKNTGHTTALHRAQAGFSRGAYISEQTGGVDYYRFLSDLHEHFAERAEEIGGKLSALLAKLVNRSACLVSLTADEAGYAAFCEAQDCLLGALPAFAYEKAVRDYPLHRKNEGLCCSAQIQYLARAGSFADAGLAYTGRLLVLQNILNYDYLWIRVRVKGGAYGCFSGFARSGESYMVSYLDPKLKETNEVFAGAAAYLEGFEADERSMARFIIGAISELDVPKTPAAQGARSLNAYLLGITDDQLQWERDEVLSATAQDMRALAPYLRAILGKECWCAVGNEEKLKENADMFDELTNL